MFEIPVSKGRTFAVVDDIDAPKVLPFTWHLTGPNGYAATWILDDGPRHRMYMQHLILPPSPGYEVDHIDRYGLNNRRHNLRECTRQQNAANRISKRKSKAGYKGVIIHARSSMFHAVISVGGRRIFLGSFASVFNAALAYDRAAREHFGEFAVVNFPEMRI